MEAVERVELGLGWLESAMANSSCGGDREQKWREDTLVSLFTVLDRSIDNIEIEKSIWGTLDFLIVAKEFRRTSRKGTCAHALC